MPAKLRCSVRATSARLPPELWDETVKNLERLLAGIRYGEILAYIAIQLWSSGWRYRSALRLLPLRSGGLAGAILGYEFHDDVLDHVLPVAECG